MSGLIIDCFAGGGGASVGIEMALGRPVDIAIDHDPWAIRMHKTNNPDTLHLTEDIFRADIQKYVMGRHVALMWASPDCTSHSKAKGGQPRQKRLRMLPWAVYKHAKTMLPDVIFMENVEEIKQWGPLDKKGRPIKELKGTEYKRFIQCMQGLGYSFSSREMVAADYGASTTRKRWYAIFRRDGMPIVWPRQTHNKDGANGLKKWEPIWKCLDFTDMGKSIFGRKKPLAENTMNRIARGIYKFVINNPEPFIVQANHEGDRFRGQCIRDPISTVTGKNGFGLATPYIMQIGQTGFSSVRNRGVDEPISTIVTKQEHCCVSPLLIQYHSEAAKNDVRGQTIKEPIMTIDASNRYGSISVMLEKICGTDQTKLQPIHTITTPYGRFRQISIFAMHKKDLEKNGIDINMTEKCTWVSWFLTEYYGNGTGQRINAPIHTIVTRDKFALVTILGGEYAIMDIFLRMLKPEELKLGQGFPMDYIIDRYDKWKRYPISQQVARIGNSVVPIMAEALVGANCGHLKIGKRTPNIKIDYSQEQLRFV